jgi:hypothetical protein
MLLLHGDGRIPQRPSLTSRLETVKNRRHGLHDGTRVRNWSPAAHGRAATPPGGQQLVRRGEWPIFARSGRSPLCSTSITRPRRSSQTPHRIEMAAHLIREGYFAGDANPALRLLPQWTEWCIEQTGLDGVAAARSRAAARTAASGLVDEADEEPVAEDGEAPFRRQE